MPAERKDTPARPEPEFWQSVDQWMDSPQFRDMMKDEFPDDAGEWLDPVSRRRFLALSGASVALAGAVGCNPSFKPASQRKVVPYVKQPEQVIAGVPLFFATAMPQQGGVGVGLLVKQVEGRPVKVEGNPNQPTSAGACNLPALASALDLYDPDRSKTVLNGTTPAKYETLLSAIKGALGKANAGQRGDGVRIVTEPTTSPTIVRLMETLLARYPGAKWLQYEPVTRDSVRKGAEIAFGYNVNTVYRFDAADVVLSLDADFLAAGPGCPRYARDFSKRRRTRDGKAALKAGDGVKADNLNRLYVVEGMVTSTGSVADHRLPLKPSQLEAFTRALAKQLGIDVAVGGDLPESAQKWIQPLAADLLAHKGDAVVVPGDHLSPAVHALCHAINKKLEAFGPIVAITKALDPLPADPKKPPLGWPKDDQFAELKLLVDEITAGKVTTLVLSGVNPVYDAPADLEFAKAVEAVRSKDRGLVVHHGAYLDETSTLASWHVNAAHYLESWGDVRGHDGTASIQQPLIAPLNAGKSLLELVGGLLDEAAADALAMVRATWADAFATQIDAATKEKYKTRLKDASPAEVFDFYFNSSLRDGVLEGTTFLLLQVGEVKLDKLPAPAAAIKDLEIQYRPDTAVYDGKQANNGWLQELPKPITNLTWDNAAIVSPLTAAKKNFTQEFAWTGGERGSTETDLAELTVEGRRLKVAVHILPGMADDLVVLHLGFGRTKAGRIATPTVESYQTTYNAPLVEASEVNAAGFNAYLLRTTAAVWSAAVPKFERTNERFYLAVAGAYHAMESRRPVRHGTVQQFKDDDEFAQVPPIAAGETELIRRNTPGTPENSLAVFGLGEKGKHPHPYAHIDSHTHGDGTVHVTGDHKPHVHDKRVIPLTLYNGSPQEVTNAKGEKGEANKTYRRWAMAIDLGSCTGCGACTLACVAENNIPVVGKDQVRRGRAMHWIRIDRYFSIPGQKVMDDELGGANVKEAVRKEKIKNSAAIRIHVQPVPCQQCEKAPCEVVCPVGATVHSADGLNDMAYNRCVGTRYCSNNCPYKVRRFNFLQYADYTTASLKLLNNPEVTVRTRGVMEKCTYCTQRIRTAEIEAEREWHKTTADGKFVRPRDTNGRPKILDGEILTACQQACPTGSIQFGDLSDDGRDGMTPAAVLRWKAEPHNYGLLAELNTMPRTSYLAAIRNPNPNMPKVEA